jgi:hypothetical protein
MAALGCSAMSLRPTGCFGGLPQERRSAAKGRFRRQSDHHFRSAVEVHVNAMSTSVRHFAPICDDECMSMSASVSIENL